MWRSGEGMIDARLAETRRENKADFVLVRLVFLLARRFRARATPPGDRACAQRGRPGYMFKVAHGP
jgi:hypothetical protein